MPTRDPRVDPLPGDEIYRPFKSASDGLILRLAERTHGGFVLFVRDNGHYRKRQWVSMEDWRKWAKKAEVIRMEGKEV